jgi:hypothetical protein
MKVYGGVDVYIHILLTLALVVDEWSALLPGRFNPRTHWIGGWVGPRAGLDEMEKRELLTLPGLGHPARSQSLYRLSYLGCPVCVTKKFNQIIHYYGYHPSVTTSGFTSRVSLYNW